MALENGERNVIEIEKNVDGVAAVNDIPMNFPDSDTKEERADSKTEERRCKDVEYFAIVP
jgi:hypothetical protein